MHKQPCTSNHAQASTSKHKQACTCIHIYACTPIYILVLLTPQVIASSARPLPVCTCIHIYNLYSSGDSLLCSTSTCGRRYQAVRRHQAVGLLVASGKPAAHRYIHHRYVHTRMHACLHTYICTYVSSVPSPPQASRPLEAGAAGGGSAGLASSSSRLDKQLEGIGRKEDQPAACHGWCLVGGAEDPRAVCQSSKCVACPLCKPYI